MRLYEGTFVTDGVGAEYFGGLADGGQVVPISIKVGGKEVYGGNATILHVVGVPSGASPDSIIAEVTYQIVVEDQS